MKNLLKKLLSKQNKYKQDLDYSSKVTIMYHLIEKFPNNVIIIGGTAQQYYEKSKYVKSYIPNDIDLDILYVGSYQDYLEFMEYVIDYIKNNFKYHMYDAKPIDTSGNIYRTSVLKLEFITKSPFIHIQHPESIKIDLVYYDKDNYKLDWKLSRIAIAKNSLLKYHKIDHKHLHDTDYIENTQIIELGEDFAKYKDDSKLNYNRLLKYKLRSLAGNDTNDEFYIKETPKDIIDTMIKNYKVIDKLLFKEIPSDILFSINPDFLKNVKRDIKKSFLKGEDHFINDEYSIVKCEGTYLTRYDVYFNVNTNPTSTRITIDE